MLLFTDGITEATNPRGEEYGENRLRQRLDIDERDTATMHRENNAGGIRFLPWQSCG